MRLVILTDDGFEHRYVASVLARHFPDELQAIVVAKPPVAVLADTRKHFERYTATQLCSRVLAKTYLAATRQHRRRQHAFARELFAGNRAAAMPRPELLRIVPSHNGSECGALLKEIVPDVIAVYGTAIIGPRIFALARVRALNMHTGLAPRYRGADTVFWPLYNEEPEWVGVTVHVLDEGIDSGPVIFTGRPQIEADDDEDRLFAKCTAVGASLYVEAIRGVMAGTVRAIPQERAAGRLYKFVDRTLGAERRVKRLVKDGLLARFARDARSRRSAEPAVPSFSTLPQGAQPHVPVAT
jgi:hypothetical protein